MFSSFQGDIYLLKRNASGTTRQEYMYHFVSLVEDITMAIHDYKMTALKCGSLSKQAIAYIYLHLETHWSLDDLAKKMSVSKSYLEHVFKDETGKTFHRFGEETRAKKRRGFYSICPSGKSHTLSATMARITSSKSLNVTKRKPLLHFVITITLATFYKAYWGSSAMVSMRIWKTLANLNTSLTLPFWMFLLLCFQLCKLS